MHRAAVGFHQYLELASIDSVFGDLRKGERGRERKGERVGLWGEREGEREREGEGGKEGRGGGGETETERDTDRDRETERDREREKEIY